MDAIMRYEMGAPVFKEDDLDQAVPRDEEARDGKDRRYSAEAIVDVLDPYAAIIDGIPAPAPESGGAS